MPGIHELATLTSKGQITLPKSIRQALGVTTGGKVAFELRGGEVGTTPFAGISKVLSCDPYSSAD